MKILFVYPSISNAGFNEASGDILFSQLHPGLCYLSAACRHAGFNDISLIDLRIISGWDEFGRKVDGIKPDIACITLMSPDYNPAIRCIDIIKSRNTATKVIVGGYHPTIMPHEMTQNRSIDHIVTGEGEAALPELLKRLEAGLPAERVVKGALADMKNLPFMDRELFDFLEMPFDFFLPLPFVTVLAGRGCSYNCYFCSPAGKLMHGYRIRRRSVDDVIKELSYLQETYGFRSLQFWDDCFTEDGKWIDEFRAAYTNAGFKQPFICQTRADIIAKNPDMIKRLKRAGLVMACIGFESGSDRILKFANKGATLKQNLAAAGVCKRLGIKIWAFNMFGFPTETKAEALDTVRMIKKIKPYRSSAAFFTPHPGSHFYDYCKKHDLSLIDDHDDFVRFPEIDKAKIKGVDYEFMRGAALKSKQLSLGVKARIRVEKIFAHKKNKAFKVKFEEEVRRSPGLNKMAVLRIARAAGRL